MLCCAVLLTLVDNCSLRWGRLQPACVHAYASTCTVTGFSRCRKSTVCLDAEPGNLGMPQMQAEDKDRHDEASEGSLQAHAQLLEDRIDLTELRAQTEILRAEAAQAKSQVGFTLFRLGSSTSC